MRERKRLNVSEQTSHLIVFINFNKYCVNVANITYIMTNISLFNNN